MILSLALGLIIGVERETRSHEEKVDTISGVRTFALTSLYGALSGYFSTVLNNSNFAVAAFFSTVMISLVTYYLKVQKRGTLGQTSEIAFILTFLVGLAVFYDTSPFFISTSIVLIIQIGRASCRES